MYRLFFVVLLSSIISIASAAVSSPPPSFNYTCSKTGDKGSCTPDRSLNGWGLGPHDPVKGTCVANFCTASQGCLTGSINAVYNVKYKGYPSLTGYFYGFKCGGEFQTLNPELTLTAPSSNYVPDNVPGSPAKWTEYGTTDKSCNISSSVGCVCTGATAPSDCHFKTRD